MSGADHGTGGRTGSEELTARAIGRAVLAETIQHPMTVLPAALAGVSGIWMLLIDFNPTSFAVGFCSSLVSLGSWVYHYFIRGEAIARRIVEERGRQRREQRVEHMRSLEEECAAIDFADGASQAREIRQEYHKLEQYLQGQLAGSGGPGVSRLLVLAEDTYREAVMMVKNAYDIYRALDAVDVGKLRRELVKWQRAQQRLHKKLGDDAGADSRYQALQTRIDGHQRTLQVFAERHGSVDQLLAESEKLESILRSTHLEMVELRSTDQIVVEGDAAGALERAVEAARRVEQRLRDAETHENKDDSIYLEAGRTAGP